ncbi:unnamed protein product, partial [Leptidea sinapis]
MMLMRLNMRVILAALCGGVLLITIYWSRCGDFTHRPSNCNRGEDLECIINGEYSVWCRRHRDEVLVPFSFIRKYFEVYGKLTSVDGVEKFEWSHSYGKVYHPKKKYDPRGTFTTFENYNVEVRDRVKCISGVEGVPVSTQWEPRGYFYPTQVAQFGLAHYSKNLTEPEPRVTVLDDGDEHAPGWTCSQDATMTREYDSELKAKVMEFRTSEQAASQVWLSVNISQDFVVSVDLLLKPNSSMTIVLQNKDKKETGHGISVLSRAYHRSGDAAYLRAARRALRPLDAPPLKALWMDRYGENSISPAKKMFDEGMVSLKALLPLFDTGSGSFYDLRHFTLGVSPNIARWDYHATHVNQLYLLAGLDPDPILINTARRWQGYMQGKRAAHN